MRTYPKVDDTSGQTVGFEIENAYVRPATVARVLASVEGVHELRRRKPFDKWEHVHAWFTYRGAACVVWEPFGDNSRYWIGQKSERTPIDMSPVEQAFKRYQPPLLRRLLGDILALRFLSKRPDDG